MLYSPAVSPSDLTSSTVASIDASSELTYTGFVLVVVVVVSRNTDFAEAGNSNGREGAASTPELLAAMHSVLLANDLERKGHRDSGIV